MKLNKNSWYVRLYAFMYNDKEHYMHYAYDFPGDRSDHEIVESTLPNNLCTFFWKFVLGLLFLPLTFFIMLPALLFRPVLKKIDAEFKHSALHDNKYKKQHIYHSGYYGYNVIVFLLTVMIIVMLSPFVYHVFDIPYSESVLYTLGIILWVIWFMLGVITGVVYTLEKIKDYMQNRNESSEERPPSFFKVTTNYIKAFKENHCPFIEWDEETNDNE